MPRERRGREHLKQFMVKQLLKLYQMEVTSIWGRTKMFSNKSIPGSKMNKIKLKNRKHLRMNQFSCQTSSCSKNSFEKGILLQRMLSKIAKLQRLNLPKNKKTSLLELTKLDRTFKYSIEFQPSHNGYQSLLTNKNSQRIQYLLLVRTSSRC